jgi:hypothetical protein
MPQTSPAARRKMLDSAYSSREAASRAAAAPRCPRAAQLHTSARVSAVAAASRTASFRAWSMALRRRRGLRSIWMLDTCIVQGQARREPHSRDSEAAGSQPFA